jgi:hypothetical protein
MLKMGPPKFEGVLPTWHKIMYNNKMLYLELTDAHLCSLHPEVQMLCSGMFHCPCELRVPGATLILRGFH